MSYCRSGDDSDVYLIGTGDCLECFGAGWRMEDENPVHTRVRAKSYHNIAANGAVVDSEAVMGAIEWVDQGDGTKRSASPKWVHEKYPRPWTLVQEGEHETHDDFRTLSRKEMIAHLDRHVAAGHRVPRYAFDRLRKEIDEVGDLYVV